MRVLTIVLVLLALLAVPLHAQDPAPERLTDAQLAAFATSVWLPLLRTCAVTEHVQLRGADVRVLCADGPRGVQLLLDTIRGVVVDLAFVDEAPAKPAPWPLRALRTVGHVFENVLYTAAAVGALVLVCQSGLCN